MIKNENKKNIIFSPRPNGGRGQILRSRIWGGGVIIILLLLITACSYTQSKAVKWGRADISYTLPVREHNHNYSYSGETVLSAVPKTVIMGYWFFISDVDGDNCPFYPSCSSFFMESVKETNIIQGSLMFADRFTRDINVFNRTSKYPEIRNGRYYDPPGKYVLIPNP
jgi:putative component of membrane protein insertase Oxa1/YidC/SpoIIIJ protein YidD